MHAQRLPPAQALEPARNWALFLDVDGTLLALADTPDGVVPNRRVSRVLEEIGGYLDGAVSLISGRSIATLDRLFAPARLPVAGLHGLERRDAGGRVHALADIEALEHLRGPMGELSAGDSRVILEDKGLALAIHYRLAPERAREIRERVEALVAPSGHDLKVIHGKMVCEVKPRHADKGSAIRAFMSERPFAGRVPVFIGDDVTDEDGFAVVNAMNGHAVRVGDGEATAARYRLEDVDEVIEWLATWPPRLGPRDERVGIE